MDFSHYIPRTILDKITINKRRAMYLTGLFVPICFWHDPYQPVLRVTLPSKVTISVSGAPTAPDLDRNVASGRQNFDVEVELWKIELDDTLLALVTGASAQTSVL